jgi:8-oxo-dGTP pyrophosphatase MutT (NUDIX family)
METRRHLTATVYIVNDGATALQEHKRHGIRIPPGGHLDRGELPHETARRECREETGLTPRILPPEEATIEASDGRSIPRPRRLMLYDINGHDGEVGHQHVDQIFYATATSREIDPQDGEAGADAWTWDTEAELRDSDVASDVVTLGSEAIRAAETR